MEISEQTRGVGNNQLITKNKWRFLPLLCGSGWAILLLVVDPLLARAPWWNYLDAGLWFALSFPLLPWLGFAGLMAFLGFVVSTRVSVLLFTLLSLALGIIPSTIWALLLSDVFPEAGVFRITADLSLAAGAMVIPLSFVALIRTMIVRWKQAKLRPAKGCGGRSIPSSTKSD